MFSPTRYPDDFNTYALEVKALVQGLNDNKRLGTNEVLIATRRIGKFFVDEIGLSIPDEGLLLIQEGIRVGILQLRTTLTREALEEVKQRVAAHVTSDWKGWWASDLRRIGLEFVEAILGLFHELQ